jgi:hypothetical protein
MATLQHDNTNNDLAEKSQLINSVVADYPILRALRMNRDQ